MNVTSNWTDDRYFLWYSPCSIILSGTYAQVARTSSPLVSAWVMKPIACRDSQPPGRPPRLCWKAVEARRMRRYLASLGWSTTLPTMVRSMLHSAHTLRQRTQQQAVCTQHAIDTALTWAVCHGITIEGRTRKLRLLSFWCLSQKDDISSPAGSKAGMPLQAWPSAPGCPSEGLRQCVLPEVAQRRYEALLQQGIRCARLAHVPLQVLRHGRLRPRP